MSDTLRAQKLAAARKKLKEFQQKAKHNKTDNKSDHAAITPIQQEDEQVAIFSTQCPTIQQQQSATNDETCDAVENTNNVTFQQEPENNEDLTEKQHDSNEHPQESTVQATPSDNTAQNNENREFALYSYFSSDGFDGAYYESNHLFDKLADNHVQYNETQDGNDFMKLSDTASYLDNQLYCNPSNLNSETQEEEQKNQSDGDTCDNVYKSTLISNEALMSDILQESDSKEEQNRETKQANYFFQQIDEKEDNQMLQEIASLQIGETPKAKNSAQQSNIESLRQLSSQMALLAEPTQSSPESEVFERIASLEKRNQQLASMLEDESVRSRQLGAQLRIKEQEIAHLEKRFESNRTEQETRVRCELGPLQEQLQNHIQTIGVLVAEKTELSAMLSQAQSTCKQKTTELEELHEKVKSATTKIFNLEAELNALKDDKFRCSKVLAEQSEAFTNLKLEYVEMKRIKDELSQDVLEVHEKLNSSSAENVKLQKQLQEVSAQLSLANIRIQQLTLGESAQHDVQLESLVQGKLALERKVSELSNSLETVTKERDQASTQYQQYVLQLNEQLSNLANKLESVTRENESLVTREQNLIRHMNELEKHLQNVQTDRTVVSVQRASESVEKDLQEALQNVEMLSMEKVQLQENFTRVCNERDMLFKDLESKKDCIRELEDLVERLRMVQPDTTKLLAEMESDKVAAARAISQNTELKKQLQDIQDDFVKMSNDKLELIEQLTREQNLNKEVTQKLQQCETQLHTLADAIAIKDHELTEIREHSEELNKQILQFNQLTDRVQHYEAQHNSAQALQTELEEANKKLSVLINENALLKETLNNSNAKNNEEDSPTDPRNKEDNGTPEKILQWQESLSTINSLDKESAMKYLEEKFLKTMQDIANLTEEKQRLEHLVLQLQSETETIGEYIALYQHQRGILKQRAIEKDEQLEQLARDRELVKNKLDLLNSLVKKLVLEKGTLTSEILEHHENLNRYRHELCEEHAKIHQEIDKITNTDRAVEVKNGVGNHEGGKDEKEVQETAEKIIELLSEIKTCNLVQPLESFHPCPWCSGKLITV